MEMKICDKILRTGELLLMLIKLQYVFRRLLARY